MQTKEKIVLIVTSVASMVDQFIIPNIKLLKDSGYQVDVATNFEQGRTCSARKIRELLSLLDMMEVDCFQVDFARKATDWKADCRLAKQLDDVMRGNAKALNPVRHHHIKKKRKYAFVHCHSPIGGVIGRIVARMNGIRAIYTAHGFHFFGGGEHR